MTYNPTVAADREALAQGLLKTLTTAGFVEEVQPASHERCFSRAVERDGKPTGVRVQVWTSIVGDQVRSAGADAIRVDAVYEQRAGKTIGVYKTSRINRVGSMIDIETRMLTKMRIVYKEARDLPSCSKCGAPMFMSKRKNLVCAAFCFAKE